MQNDNALKNSEQGSGSVPHLRQEHWTCSTEDDVLKIMPIALSDLKRPFGNGAIFDY